MKTITKEQAKKASKTLQDYAKQESKKGVKASKEAVAKVKSVTKKGVSEIKKFFK